MKPATLGARFLDKVRPGWADEIDLDKLDLQSTCDCVLGQLHGLDHPYSRPAGRFERMLKRLHLDVETDEEVALGFDADPNQTVINGEVFYKKLTADWKRVIRSRRTV